MGFVGGVLAAGEHGDWNTTTVPRHLLSLRSSASRELVHAAPATLKVCLSKQPTRAKVTGNAQSEDPACTQTNKDGRKVDILY